MFRAPLRVLEWGSLLRALRVIGLSGLGHFRDLGALKVSGLRGLRHFRDVGALGVIGEVGVFILVQAVPALCGDVAEVFYGILLVRKVS